MTISELAKRVPAWPRGHVNNKVRKDLLVFIGHPIETEEQVAELHGLIARAYYLIQNPPVSAPPAPPVGGTPVQMALAA